MHPVASDRTSCTTLAFRRRSNCLLRSTAWSKHSRAQSICCQSSSLTPSIRATTRKGTPHCHPLIRTPVEGNTSPQQGRIKRVSLPTKHLTSNKEQATPGVINNGQESTMLRRVHYSTNAPNALSQRTDNRSNFCDLARIRIPKVISNKLRPKAR